MNSVMDNLASCHRLICQVSLSISNRMNYQDTDDVISFAVSAVAKAMLKYDPSRSAPTTFIHTVLQSKLPRYISQCRRMTPMSSYETDEQTRWADSIADYRVSDALPSRITDLLDNCSDSVKEVVEICFTEKIQMYGAKTVLRNILKKRGWSDWKINRAFNELSGIIAAW